VKSDYERRRLEDREAFAAELLAERNRLERQEALERARVTAPLAWALSDFLGDLWRAHNYPFMTGLLGNEGSERFDLAMSWTWRQARLGREITHEIAERGAALAWDFVMHEDAMTDLGQRIEADAEPRIVAASSAA
jgi:hypothetical protein